MTSVKSMDELFWCKEYEDVHDWVEMLEMLIGVLMNQSYLRLVDWIWKEKLNNGPKSCLLLLLTTTDY